jgi:hypothetical protein
VTEILQEKWMKGVAVTTTILAVATAIAAARGAACTTKTQLLTAIEGSKWAYYQAKSIKQNLAEVQHDAFEVQALGALTLEQKTALDNKLKTYALDIARYDQEKNSIKKEAEDVGIQNALLNKKAGKFALAIVFFQIGIMLSSVSALLKRKEMWIAGLVFGALASIFLAYGLFLKPLLF